MQCYSCKRDLPDGTETIKIWSHEAIKQVDICMVCHEFSLKWNKLNPPGSFHNSAAHAKAESDLLDEWKAALEFSS